MKKLLTALGTAALIAGVTPYRYSKNEETGEQKIQALLWRATRTPRDGEKDKTVVNIGFISPFERKKGESEICVDGVTGEYGGGLEEDEPVMVVQPAPAEEPAEEAAAAAPEENSESGDSEEAAGA